MKLSGKSVFKPFEVDGEASGLSFESGGHLGALLLVRVETVILVSIYFSDEKLLVQKVADGTFKSLEAFNVLLVRLISGKMYLMG